MQFRRAMVACVVLAGCRVNFSERDPDAMEVDAVVDAPAPVRLRIIGYGALTGSGGIACADDCMAPVDGPVTITATAGETWTFDHFDPPCGSQPTCTLMPGQTAAATFVAQPITANRAFVTPMAATLGPSGRNGLDLQCQMAAAAGSLPGTFIALVSTTTQDAVNRLAGSRGWVRMDGLPLLDQPSDLGLGTLPRGVMFDPMMGQHPGMFVLTGSDGMGRLVVGNNCTDFTVVGAQSVGGIADAAMHFMIGMTSSGCNGLLYCFETGKSVAVSTVPPRFPVGRYVFTATSWDTTTGVAGADATCQSQAAAASLPGTYQAVLATSTQSVIERLGALDGAWRRPDLASVTRTGLAAGNYSATFSVTAAGAPLPDFAVFGAPSLTERASLATNCTDWTVNTPAAFTLYTFRMSPFTSIGQAGCGLRPVVCVQTQ